MRSLNLVAIVVALASVEGPQRIELYGDVVSAALRIELHPIGGRGVPDQKQRLRVEVVQNAVTDDITFWRTSEELLGRPGSKGLEGIDAQPLENSQCIPTADTQVVHVIALIVQGNSFAP